MSLVTFGNMKIPKTTAIFNICPASMCPSRALGLCQLDKVEGCSSSKCYAMAAEQRYGKPHVLPHRMRQMEAWDRSSPPGFVAELISAFGKRKVTALRLNEAGDFRHYEDLKKAVQVAYLLAYRGIVTYCYTARKDLVELLEAQYGKTPSSMVINGSGWKAHNQYTVVPRGTAKQYIKEHPGARRCAGDCRKCSLCLKARGIEIVNEVH